MESLETIAKVAAVVIGLTSLVITAHQARINTRVNQGRFWLDLRRMFSEHSEVHSNLRDGGKWCVPTEGPSSGEEWVKVEAYMGLFEHFNIMLEQKLIDWTTFERIYAYRLRLTITQPGHCRKKLMKHWGERHEFVQLVEHKLKERIERS